MRVFSTLFALFSAFTVARSFSSAPKDGDPLPRLLIYVQTTHDSHGNPISILPLIQEHGIALTHLIISTFHVRAGKPITLNDDPPSDNSFKTLWAEAAQLKAAGVKIMGMIGGFARGSWTTTTLDSPDEEVFESCYDQIYDTIMTYGLQGMDLDIEQPMSFFGVKRLINRLKQDFGPDFIISLAPVAIDIKGRGGVSGFSYRDLESELKESISHYNVQFYNGWGSLSSSDDYDTSISQGYPADRVVAGAVTSTANGRGYVGTEILNATIQAMVEAHGSIGGVSGWEYFNALPGNTSEPWKWAQEMTAILRPNRVPYLKITEEDAKRLTAIYAKSKRTIEDKAMIEEAGRVDYYKWVNTWAEKA